MRRSDKRYKCADLVISIYETKREGLLRCLVARPLLFRQEGMHASVTAFDGAAAAIEMYINLKMDGVRIGPRGGSAMLPDSMRGYIWDMAYKDHVKRQNAMSDEQKLRKKLLGELRYALLSEWIKHTPADKHDWHRPGRGLARSDVGKLFVRFRQAQETKREMFTFRKDRYTVKFAALLLQYLDKRYGADPDYQHEMSMARGEVNRWIKKREEQAT